MMHDVFSILAESSDSSAVPVIFGLIVGAIWVAAHITSKLKQSAAPKPLLRSANQRIPMARPAQLANASIPLPRLMPVPQKRMAAKQVAIPPANRLTMPAKAPIRLMPPALPAQSQAKVPAPAPRVRAVPAPAPPETSLPAVAHLAPVTRLAASLNLWMRPDTMRRQFILTEILRAPVALREEHG